jgi:PKHD-type hydroxylase
MVKNVNNQIFGPKAIEVMSIPNLLQPLEQVITWDKAFNSEEILDIISLGEMAEFQQGVIGATKEDIDDGNSPFRHVPEVRNSDVSWILPSEQSEWLYRRMQNLCAKVNSDKFQFDLEKFEVFQYGKYKEGQFYNWHIDAGPNLMVHRKLSLMVALTPPEEYEGGEICINTNGNQDEPLILKMEPGSVIVIPSWVPHVVKPITKGERVSLVAWVTGPKFR